MKEKQIILSRVFYTFLLWSIRSWSERYSDLYQRGIQWRTFSFVLFYPGWFVAAFFSPPENWCHCFCTTFRAITLLKRCEYQINLSTIFHFSYPAEGFDAFSRLFVGIIWGFPALCWCCCNNFPDRDWRFAALLLRVKLTPIEKLDDGVTSAVTFNFWA